MVLSPAAGCLQEGEVIVQFDPVKTGESELLKDARLIACQFVSNTHVIAYHRDEHGGRTSFRKYDNDSKARSRGTYERVSARSLWMPACQMTAITVQGSALHRAAGNIPQPGARRVQRQMATNRHAPSAPQEQGMVRG